MYLAYKYVAIVLMMAEASGGFHHRLRGDESYGQKWQYVRENPVRQGLVMQAEDWPFWGRVHEIGR
jgi:hypothetical protein